MLQYDLMFSGVWVVSLACCSIWEDFGFDGREFCLCVLLGGST